MIAQADVHARSRSSAFVYGGDGARRRCVDADVIPQLRTAFAFTLRSRNLSRHRSENAHKRAAAATSNEKHERKLCRLPGG